MFEPGFIKFVVAGGGVDAVFDVLEFVGMTRGKEGFFLLLKGRER